jgi:hypothetical protein
VSIVSAMPLRGVGGRVTEWLVVEEEADRIVRTAEVVGFDARNELMLKWREEAQKAAQDKAPA